MVISHMRSTVTVPYIYGFIVQSLHLRIECTQVCFILVILLVTVMLYSHITQGNVLRSHIDGCIQMKSFLTGDAEIRLGLNEELTIGRESSRLGGVVLDDCNFHESAEMENFEKDRSLSIMAPDGEVRVYIGNLSLRAHIVCLNSIV